MGLLDKIDSPEALRRLTESELPRVAEEVRERTIDAVAITGGHLGASLGVVELTVALHYVFNTPEDRLVWDVGHQSYPHKILTGRSARMDTMRQKGGLSGFTKRDESPYDPFGTGHSSTSISAALGMAVAAHKQKKSRKCVAIIGDGAMTAGLALEALNNAGARKETDLIVILNDNEMSISPNVGALSSYFSRILTSGFYTSLKGGTELVLGKISPPLQEVARRAEGHVRGIITPGTIFEELGFDYFGPIDGHDFSQLLPTLRNIRKISGPVLLHVITKKGKGFLPAEANPCTYHGVPPFDRATGHIPAGNGTPSYTKVFAEALCELALRDPRIVAVTAAMPEGTGLNRFQERFPTRFFDVGIAEQHAVTFAAGLACEGFIPVVAIYSTFLQRAYDQIVHDVALQKLPVVFAIDRAGLVGQDGPTHAGVFDLSFLRNVPGLTLMAPADENELRHLLATAIASGKPAALRYPRGEARGLPPEPPTPLAEGCGRLLRTGTQVALAAVGPPVYAAMAAAERLEEEGISASVMDFRFVKPLDRNLARQAAAHEWLFLIEEGTECGGFGGGVLEFLAGEGLLDQGCKVRLIAIPDRFIPHASQAEQRAETGLDAASIAARVKSCLHSDDPPAP